MAHITNDQLSAQIQKLEKDMIRLDANLAKEIVATKDELEKYIDTKYLQIRVYEVDMLPLKKFVYGVIALLGATFFTGLAGLLYAVS